MSTLLYDHKWMDLREDGNGEAFVKMDGDQVMIVAVNEWNEILFIREKSIAYQVETLSLPTGGIEKHERPEMSAYRELREETGYAAREIEYVATLHPSIKYMQWQCHVYLARQLINAPLKGDETSPITVKPVALDEVDFLISAAQLTDSTAIAALHLISKHLETERRLALIDVMIVNR
jgi:ADP-ribose diphosphatase